MKFAVHLLAQGSPMVIHKKQKTKKRTKKKQKTLLNTSSSGGDMDRYVM